MTRLRDNGFTLIELMIVVAILAILMAIAVPAYQDYTIRAQVSEGMHLGSGARAAIWDFWSNTGNMPASNSEAGLVPPSSIAGRYVSKLEIDNGEVVIWFDTGAENAAITGKTLILTPSPVPGEGAMAWECNQGTVPERYLPARCR